MTTKTIKLGVHGCDDSTEVELVVTEEQEAFLRKVAERVTAAAEHGCQPTMEIEDKK